MNQILVSTPSAQEQMTDVIALTSTVLTVTQNKS